MTRTSTDFGKMVSKFLTEYLPLQKGCSKNTILSYRDSIKLYIRYLDAEHNIRPERIKMQDFNRENVLGFLKWYQSSGASIGAANQRLAGLKSLAKFAQYECVELLEPLQGIIGIQARRHYEKEIAYLTTEQMSILINRPDVNTTSGYRHRITLTLLYDSGCRVQELCDLTIGDIVFSNITTIRLVGKGQKTRTVTVSDETGRLIQGYLNRYRPNSLKTDYLITNKTGGKLTRDGVSYIIDKYAREIRKADPAFPSKVHCHMFRHSKAMHMLEAGINIVYIRDYLGHEDISTTMIYLKNSYRLKDQAMSKLIPKITEHSVYPDWSKDQSLMEFLNSFQ